MDRRETGLCLRLCLAGATLADSRQLGSQVGGDQRWSWKENIGIGRPARGQAGRRRPRSVLARLHETRACCCNSPGPRSAGKRPLCRANQRNQAQPRARAPSCQSSCRRGQPARRANVWGAVRCCGAVHRSRPPVTLPPARPPRPMLAARAGAVVEGGGARFFGLFPALRQSAACVRPRRLAAVRCCSPLVCAPPEPASTSPRGPAQRRSRAQARPQPTSQKFAPADEADEGGWQLPNPFPTDEPMSALGTTMMAAVRRSLRAGALPRPVRAATQVCGPGVSAAGRAAAHKVCRRAHAGSPLPAVLASAAHMQAPQAQHMRGAGRRSHCPVGTQAAAARCTLSAAGSGRRVAADLQWPLGRGRCLAAGASAVFGLWYAAAAIRTQRLTRLQCPRGALPTGSWLADSGAHCTFWCPKSR